MFTRRFLLVIGIFLLATCVLPGTALAAGCDGANILFSEIDYDQPSTDTTEFLELRIRNAATVSDCEIRLVNGNGGTVYDTISLAGAYPAGKYVVIGSTNIAGRDLGFDGGACSQNCLQNDNDGVALVDTSGGGETLVAFIAYEGDVSYLGASATGINCTDNPSGDNSCNNGSAAGHGDWYVAAPTPGSCGPNAVAVRGLAAGSVSPMIAWPSVCLGALALAVGWRSRRWHADA